MKIAAYVNPQGEVEGFSEHGSIRLYESGAMGWAIAREFRFGVTYDMTLSDIKSALRKAVSLLGDCRVFVFGETRGLLYAILQEELGYRVWNSKGLAEDCLDAVALKNAEALQVPRPKPPQPEAGGGCGGMTRLSGAPGQPLVEPLALGNGRFRIDLAAVLAANPASNSQEVLLPLLRRADFAVLDIACDHLPRWFEGVLAALGLRSEVHHRVDGSLMIEVSPRRHAPPSNRSAPDRISAGDSQ
jgi:Fe-only nitrogenase accessory protein AnfO